MVDRNVSALFFTVLTPTHNRAAVISRTFESLQSQTFRAFEWLVIDDGSTDATADVIQACAQRAGFPVRYVRQSHGHKKTAFNLGVRSAAAEMLLVLDDDDELLPDSLERLWATWQDIPVDQRDGYIGVVGLCAGSDMRIVGDRFPRDVMDCTATDMYFLHGVRGEKFGCQRTAVLRDFPYPENIPGFVPESLVWWAIAAQGWRTRFINQVVRTYHQTQVSLSTAGKASGAPERHALGLYLLNWSWVEQQLPYFRHAPLAFALAAARLTRFRLAACRAGQQGLLQQYPVTRWPARLLVALMAPLGWLMDRRQRRR